jgi:hypothetical protein
MLESIDPVKPFNPQPHINKNYLCMHFLTRKSCDGPGSREWARKLEELYHKTVLECAATVVSERIETDVDNQLNLQTSNFSNNFSHHC